MTLTRVAIAEVFGISRAKIERLAAAEVLGPPRRQGKADVYDAVAVAIAVTGHEAPCLKCWADVTNFSDGKSGGRRERYLRLYASRDRRACSPEDQAGPRAGICAACCRAAVHPITSDCFACGGGDRLAAPQRRFRR